MSEHIEYHRFARGEVCTYEGCPSKRYYIADGKRFCNRGHEQEGFRQVQQDEDDFNSQGRITRRKREGKEKVERVLSGRDAVQLYLHCYQLVLWKQVKWLIDVKGLPPELETVVRDLWSVRLRGVKLLGKENVGARGIESLGFSSQSDWEQTGTDTDGFGSSGGEGKGNRKNAREHRLPRLIDSLALCYLGAMLMRLPLTLGELYRWAQRQDLIFIRAIREIPKEMRDRLPGHYFAALESRTAMRRGGLQRAVLELVVPFNQEFGIAFPPLNDSLVFFKYVRDLCLPLEIYAAARKLGHIAELGFSFPNDLRHMTAIGNPEVQVISLIIIATKLCQPFDDIVRVPENITDPSGLRVDWGLWSIIMAEEVPKGLNRGQEINVTDQDVFRMEGKELDDYLDWYQQTWLDDRDSKLPQSILDLFPLEEVTPKKTISETEVDSTSKRLKSIGEGLMIIRPIAPEDEEKESRLYRAGSCYRYYRSVDNLPEKAKIFYDKVAEMSGMPLEILVRAVYLVERRLQIWTARQKGRGLSNHYDLDQEFSSGE